MIFKNGSFYEGEWDDDMLNGYGRLIYSNGDMYEGEWWNNQCYGKGFKIDYDTKATYTG